MTEVTFDLSYCNTVHACGKLHRAYLPWGQLNFLPEKTSKRCWNVFFHSGTRAAAELSVGWFPGFRNQVHFLDSLPSKSPAAARETIFHDIPLALTLCGCPGPEFGSEQPLFGAHTSHWFPRREGSGGTSVVSLMFCLCQCLPSEQEKGRCWRQQLNSSGTGDLGTDLSTPGVLFPVS